MRIKHISIAECPQELQDKVAKHYQVLQAKVLSNGNGIMVYEVYAKQHTAFYLFQMVFDKGKNISGIIENAMTEAHILEFLKFMEVAEEQ